MYSPTGKRSILIVVLSGLFLFGVFLNTRAFLLKEISSDFGVSYTGSGLIFLFSVIGAFVTNLTAGKVMARFGMRILFTVGMVLFGLFIFMQSLAHLYSLFLVGTILMSVVAGGQNVGGNSLVGSAFAADGGRTLNFMHVFYGLGAFCAPLLAGWLSNLGLSWREIFRLIALAYLAVLLYVPFHRMREHTERSGLRLTAVWECRHRLKMRLLTLAIMAAVGFEVGFSSWIVYTLREGFSFSPARAGIYLSGYFLALAGGRLLGSFLFRGERGLHLLRPLALLQVGTGFLSVLLLPGGAFLLVVNGFTIAVFFPILFYLLDSLRHPSRPAAIAFFMIGAGLGACLVPFLIGALSDLLSIRLGLLVAAACSVLLAMVLLRYPLHGAVHGES